MIQAVPPDSTPENRPTATDLANLLEAHPSFSFLRLGDGELRFLLECQKSLEPYDGPQLRPSCEIAHGTPAVESGQYDRLLQAYEQCSFLDLYAELPFNSEYLPQLRWQRSAQALGNASSGAVGLIFEWLYQYLQSYLRTHRCLICGAEASLLRELLADPRYRAIVAPFWPAEAQVTFVQPRNDGVSLARDLDLIKEDLRREIQEHQVDTIFLSLGGGAKILCHELAVELGIRAIDFGSALRSLTFSGSDGQAVWRAPHHPFLIRVPLDVYIPALRRARPDLGPAEILAKAHAQLCLELQSKKLLTSITSDVNDMAMFDPSPENSANFSEGLAYYRRELVPMARGNDEALELTREFRSWRRKKGLGLDGRLFRLGVVAKDALRRAGLIQSAK